MDTTSDINSDIVSSFSNVSDWTSTDIELWLRENSFDNYIELFTTQHRIDGKSLLLITENDLRLPPLSISVLGDIKRLMILINDLKASNSHGLNNFNISNGTVHHYRRGFPKSKSHGFLNIETSENNKMFNSDASDGVDQQSPNSVAKSSSLSQISHNLKPDFCKLLISFCYMFLVFMLTAFVMVIVHDRVPDMNKYPPLPDIMLDNLPYIPWAFEACETTAVILMIILFIMLLFHKHRFIILRRLFALTGTVFMLRCVTMLITSLSVPGTHLQCEPKNIGTVWSKLERALVIWSGFGMSLQGVRTCGDYMFSGHTVIVTLFNFFITEYTPQRIPMLHTVSWIMNIFAIFFILAAHEHYSIDVFVAFYITSRLFLYYHSLANNLVLRQPDQTRTRIWFPLFSYFESSINGIVPNEFEWPVPDFLQRLLTKTKSEHSD